MCDLGSVYASPGKRGVSDGRKRGSKRRRIEREGWEEEGWREEGGWKDTTPLHPSCGGNPAPQLANSRKTHPFQHPKPSKPYRMIELGRPQPMQEQHLLRLELEQPRMCSNRREADVRVRRVVCSGAFGLLAGGLSFCHARCVSPQQVCGSSSHRRIDPSFLMSTRLVHQWR